MHLYSIVFYFLLFILGLAVGSFLNVVIYRFPREYSLVSPSSACTSCGHHLNIADLFPLFSYLFLRGKCRYCGAKVSPRYFLVELITGMLFVIIPLFEGFNLESGAFLFLLCLLLVISLIDIEFRRIPNMFLLIGLGVGVILKFIDSLMHGTWVAWGDAGLGMLIGGGIMLLIFIVGRGGMGAGDFKLMLMIGFFVGMQGVILVIFLGFIMGGVYAVAMLLLKRLNRKAPVPFGPFLSLAVLVEIFWGAQIWSWYLKMSGLIE